MALTIKNDYPDSETLLNIYFAIVYAMGYPKKLQKQGTGPFKMIPAAPAYLDPFVPSYGWAYQPVSLYDGPNPGEEGLVFGDAILAFDGVTRNVPTIGPVLIDLSGNIEVPADWVQRAPPQPPWF